MLIKIYCFLMAWLFFLVMISFIFDEFDSGIYVINKFFDFTSFQDFFNDLSVIDLFILVLFFPVLLIFLFVKLLYRFYKFLESIHPFARTFKPDNKGGDELGK